MAKKIITSVGIEYDAAAIRAARLSSVREGKKLKYTVEILHEMTGDYTKDDVLIGGLKATAEKMGVKARDRVVTSVSGKQVFVGQVKFKELPDEEMKSALRFEIGKGLPFEVAGAALDYQILKNMVVEKKDNKVTVMVTAVANALLSRQLRILDKADIKPWVVDVLPLAVANAFWAERPADDPFGAHVLIHLAPDVCSVVIDSGNGAPFYSRSIYFAAEEIFGPMGQTIAEVDRTRRLEGLGDEFRRSLSYYEKNYNVTNFGWLYLVGNYVQNPVLRKLIQEKLGLPMDESPLLTRIGSPVESEAGKFDLALSLALRGSEGP